ncbi:MAG: tyrosine-type recombinase/integrase [Pseudomonadales bacterium]|nr:tyrosine-type recombinase/integrase [Pseudomonadales bacterium]
MGAISDNRIKFNKPNLKAIENRINRGEFTKETYIYDADSHLAVRARPGRSYIDSVFCMYARIRVRGECKSRMYKRQIMRVGEARNAEITISELRQKVDSLFLEIQEGRDPQVIAQKEAAKQADNQGLIEARRSFKDMIYGTPVDESDECLPDGFIAERRPGQRYLVDIRNKCEVLLVDLLDLPLHSISPEQVKTVYLQKVGRGKTQLDCAMRILRSIWNWAQTKYDDSDLFIRNPVSRAMKQLGVNINRTNRCTGRLDDVDFKPYLKSVLKLREHDHTSAYRNGRDALLFMLFSGVRRTGTMTVRMEGIDLDRLVFKIIKKGGDQVELPLNTVTAAIVRNRQDYLPKDAEYLFPGMGGRGYYRDTKAVRDIVKNQTGISVTNHDLRRTYKSIGTELDINSVLVDELLSHAREGVDAHYIHPSMTRLRDASQKIADYMVKQAGFDLIDELTSRW